MNLLVGKEVVCKLKRGQEYKGILMAIDGYLNLQINNAKEHVDEECEVSNGHTTSDWKTFGLIFIRSNNVLYIREISKE